MLKIMLEKIVILTQLRGEMRVASLSHEYHVNESTIYICNICSSLTDFREFIMEKGSAPGQVFNSDEIGLLYKKIGDWTYISKEEKVAREVQVFQGSSRTTFLWKCIRRLLNANLSCRNTPTSDDDPTASNN